MVKADHTVTQICIRLSCLYTLAYIVFVAAELSEGSFFKHKIKNNSSPLILSLFLSLPASDIR